MLSRNSLDLSTAAFARMESLKSTIRDLRNSISIVDFSRLLCAGWEVDYDYDSFQEGDGLFEMRKRINDNTDSLMVIVSRRFDDNISSFEMLRQVIPWEGTVDDDVKAAFTEVDSEAIC